jgi:putative aldouronate transport system permease protein
MTKSPSANKRLQLLDIILIVFLTAYGITILFPFYNVIIVSFTSQKEYFLKSIVLFPSSPSLDSYQTLFKDGRIWVGYRTTLLILATGLPVNLILTTTMAYGLSRPVLPGKRFFIFFIIFTMLFDGGIIPLYIIMRTLALTNKVWSVVLAYGINTFYLIIMRNYFLSLPDSLVESARLDGAGDWRIMLQIILPLSKPIIATIALFYFVDRWNEWFYAMIFIRRNDMVPLQLVLRNIVIESQVLAYLTSSSGTAVKELHFTMGLKMATVMVTMLPVMCIFPFLQKHFIKGILVGAIKA